MNKKIKTVDIKQWIKKHCYFISLIRPKHDCKFILVEGKYFVKEEFEYYGKIYKYYVPIGKKHIKKTDYVYIPEIKEIDEIALKTLKPEYQLIDDYKQEMDYEYEGYSFMPFLCVTGYSKEKDIFYVKRVELHSANAFYDVEHDFVPKVTVI